MALVILTVPLQTDVQMGNLRFFGITLNNTPEDFMAEGSGVDGFTFYR